MKRLKKAFQKQKWHARERGIEFELTFEQWHAIWLQSGHLEQRGRRRDQYVMARHGDAGAYAVSNVKIVTAAENAGEQTPPWIGRTHSPEARLKIGAGKIGNTNGRGNKGRVFRPETIERRRQTMIARGHW